MPDAATDRGGFEHYDLGVDPDQDVPNDDDVYDNADSDDAHSEVTDTDEFDDDDADRVVASAPADRYKRRVESRPATSGGGGKALAIAAILIAGLAGLVIWLQPWNSTPLDITSVSNERVELVELIGANGCLWHFDIEIANTADERVWITTLELFLNDDVVRPEITYGFIDPGVESAIPVQIFLGDAEPGRGCQVPATIDHSSLDLVHATLGETFTASTSF